MPCQCDPLDAIESYHQAADKATRAACDMRTIIRRHGLEAELTKETRQWIRRHDKADAERIENEIREKIRDSKRLKALEKLNLEERRILGV